MRAREVGLSTDDLIRLALQEHCDLDANELRAAIPAAIDAIYTARDSGKDMHVAGAAAAVAALKAVRRVEIRP